jgi:hypothetical protein
VRQVEDTLRQTKTLIRFVAAVLLSALGIMILVSGVSRFPRLEPKQVSAHPWVSTSQTRTPPRLVSEYARLPLRFEANQGQSDPRVQFLSRGPGYTLFLTPEEAVLALRQSAGTRTGVVRLKLAGANPAAARGLDPLGSESHYLTGNEPRRWRTAVVNYGRVRYERVYPGIDLVYYGSDRKLEYDFVVAPGADPQRIRLEVAGAAATKLDERGDLLIQSGAGTVRLHKPLVYQDAGQEAGGSRRQIEGAYTLLAQNQVGFALGEYDRSKPLVIDPVLNYASYLGGAGDDNATAVAVDADGNAYIAGITASVDFPVATNFQPAPKGGEEIFVTKLNKSGSSVAYSTYIGGSGSDRAAAIAVDREGHVYVAGATSSSDFPLQAARFAVLGGAEDAFVLKLQADGSGFVFSTYLGGSAADQANAIALDGAGGAVIAGKTASPDFPLAYPLQSQCSPAADGTCSTDAFVTKLGAEGALLYSTYLGGSGPDQANGVAIDTLGYVYVAGSTGSANFPTVNAAQPGCKTDESGACTLEAFVAKLTPDFAGLFYSTYIGGSGNDQANGVAVDAAGNAYLAGRTTSADLPVLDAIQPACSSSEAAPCSDAFVAKIGVEGLVRFATYLGGRSIDQASAIALDHNGDIYVAGTTASDNFPLLSPIQETCGKDANGQCSVDAFLTKLSGDGASVIYSTYVGGGGVELANAVAVDPSGAAIIAGRTDSPDFPTSKAIQADYKGVAEAFIAKLTDATMRTMASACDAATPTRTWSPVSDQAWDNPGNWTPNYVPTATDIVCVASGAPPIISSTATAQVINADIGVTLSSGSLTLGNSPSCTSGCASHLQGGFAVYSGTLNLTANSTMSISATGVPGLYWSGGTIQGYGGGAGSISAEGISFTGSSSRLLSGVALTNTGVGTKGASFSGGEVNIGNGGMITNATGATLNLLGPGTFGMNAAPTDGVVNNGTVNMAHDAADMVTFWVPFTNATGGIVNVSLGKLNLGYGVRTGGLDSGTFAVQTASATLKFSGGTHTVTGVIQGPSGGSSPGTVEFYGGTVQISSGANYATYNVAGKTWINGGSAYFNSGSVVTNVGALQLDSEGAVVFNTGSAISPTKIDFNNGALSGADNVSTAGRLTWTSGWMRGTGTPTPTTTAASVTFNDGYRYLDRRKLINNGVADMLGGSFYFQNGATFENQPGATLNASGYGCLYDYETSPEYGPNGFNNYGTLNLNSAEQYLDAYVAFNNKAGGIVNVNAGALYLDYGGDSSGAFNVATGAELDFSGTHYLKGSITGPGDVYFYGGEGYANITLGGAGASGTYNVQGMTAVEGAYVDFITGMTVQNIPNLAVTYGGELGFDTGSEIIVGSLTLDYYGAVGGTDTITVNGPFTWYDGGVYGSGETACAPGGPCPVINVNGPLDLSCSPQGYCEQYLYGRRLYNSGTATMSGYGYMYMGAGAEFHNMPSGTFNAENDEGVYCDYYYGCSGATFVNDGVFNKNTSNWFGVETVFNNTATGHVNVNGGYLYLAGGGTIAGAFAVAQYASLEFESYYGDDGYGAGFQAQARPNRPARTPVATTGAPRAARTPAAATGARRTARTLTAGSRTTAPRANQRLHGAARRAARKLSRSMTFSGGARPGSGLAASVLTAPGGTIPVKVSGAISVMSSYGALPFYLEGSLTGPGMVDFYSGDIHVAGTYGITGSTICDGANVTFAPIVPESGPPIPVTVASVGSLLVSYGTINFSSGNLTPIQPTAIALGYGTLSGSDTITTSGQFDWYDGTLAGSGVLNANGTTNINGYPYLDTRTLNLGGTTTLGSYASMYLYNGAHLNNSGQFTAQSGSGVYNESSEQGNTVSNAGQLNIGMADESLVQIHVDSFLNSGTLNVTPWSGLCIYNLTQTAGSIVMNEGSRLGGAAQIDIQGGTLSGTGEIYGDLTNTSAAGIRPAATSSPPSLMVYGNYTQTAPGALNLDIAAADSFGTFWVMGPATLGGTLNISLLNSYVPAAGLGFRFLGAQPVSGNFTTINGAQIGANYLVMSPPSLFTWGETMLTGLTMGTVTGNPVPVISSLSRTVAPAGSQGFQLTVNGYNFIPNSAVFWNGAQLATYPINANVLIADVPAPKLATAGTYPVTVVNPANAGDGTGGTSNAVNFTVLATGGTLSTASNHVAVGGIVHIPIFLSLGAGASVDALSFRVQLTPPEGSPPPPAPMTFVRNSDPSKGPVLPLPNTIDNEVAPNQIAVSWYSPPLTPPLTGDVYLGDVIVTAPSTGITPGQTASVQVTDANGSFGTSTSVVLTPAPASTITVTGTYLVGDAYPFTGSNVVGQFGDGSLLNLDLVNMLRASLNFSGYLAPECSDRYNAMDADNNGLLDTLDLIMILNRMTFESQPWPQRGTRGLYCPAALGPTERDSDYRLMAERQKGGTAGLPIMGELKLGAPESTASGVRVPIYLYANGDLDLSGFSYGLRLRNTVTLRPLRFVRGNAGDPSLLDQALTGKLAGAWLNGLKAVTGQVLLLGYVEIQGGDTAAAAALDFTGVQANARADGARVRIDYPLPGQKQSWEQQ